MPADHSLYHYSVTVRAEDKPVLGALRGLSFEVQTGPHSQISSGGTTGDEWAANDREVTFRFTSSDLRSEFLTQAARIFRPGLWKLISTNDNDPATPRRRSRVP